MVRYQEAENDPHLIRDEETDRLPGQLRQRMESRSRPEDPTMFG